jgi:hypothetical protein
MNRRYNTMWKTSIALAVMVLMLAASAASADNEVYLDPQTVYIPECGNAIVQIRMDVTDTIDTWSTMIEFDDTCVNITDVDFSGGVTPTNASWGHHVDYIYLGGTELTNVTGDHLLATLTIECKGSSCGPVDLGFGGEENSERLIAGPPDGTPPYGTIYSATWTNGSAQCVGCGDVNCVDGVNIFDAIHLSLKSTWAGDVNCVDGVNIFDAIHLYYNVTYPSNPTYALTCCGCT